MSKIIMRNNKVAVEKINKGSSKKDSFLVLPDSPNDTGRIIYLGPNAGSDLKVDQTVYFASNYQNVRMEGRELCVMNDDNILGIVDENVTEQSSAKT